MVFVSGNGSLLFEKDFFRVLCLHIGVIGHVFYMALSPSCMCL